MNDITCNTCGDVIQVKDIEDHFAQKHFNAEITFASLPDIESQKNDFSKAVKTDYIDVEKMKLELKNWGYDNQQEYKNYIRAEYQRVFHTKKLSRGNGKIIQGLIIVFMVTALGYGAINYIPQLKQFIPFI